MCGYVVTVHRAGAKLVDDAPVAPTASNTWTAEVESDETAPAPDSAESARSSAPAHDESGWRASGRLGYAMFLHARSLAVEHRFKPGLKLSLSKPVGESWEFGGALSGILDSDSNYGVWAGYGVGRYSIGGRDFRAGATLGVGVGHNAPILHSDLTADAAVSPYAMLALDALWRVADDFWLGAELSDEQLSVVYLGAMLKWQL